MRRVSLFGFVGAVTLVSSAAIAADYPQPYAPPPPPAYVPPPPAYVPPPPPIAPPPPPAYYTPPPAADFGGWYLRGDIGITTQKVKSLDNVLNYSPGSTFTPIHYEFDSGMTFGVGAGYQFNSWFRADVTAEYRGKTGFNGLETYSGVGFAGTDEYRGYKKEYVGLINIYADLGTWWCLTPFVGVGAGLARVEIGGFTDINTPNGGVAYAAKAYKDNVAYALHAGVAYKASNSLTFELAYRYLNLGDGITGDLRTYDGINNVNNPTTFKSITSQDLRFGVRWQLEPTLIAPAPVPVQAPLPALMRRG